MKNTIIIIAIIAVLGGVGFVLYNKDKGNMNTVEIKAPETQVNINQPTEEVASDTKPVTQSDKPIAPAPEGGYTYTMDVIKTHNTKNSCWMAIDGKVYDATLFIASGMHNDKILNGCGKDATAMFNSIPKHAGDAAKEQLSKQLIGTLAN